LNHPLHADKYDANCGHRAAGDDEDTAGHGPPETRPNHDKGDADSQRAKPENHPTIPFCNDATASQ